MPPPPPYPGRPGPSHPGRRPPAGRGTGAHPTRQPGGPPRRTLKNQDQKLIPPEPSDQDVTPVKDRGKQAGGRQAEIIGRSSDQYASHRELLSTVTGSSTVTRRSYEGHTTLPVRIDPAAKTQGQWGRHECRDGGSARKGRVLRCRYRHVPCDR